MVSTLNTSSVAHSRSRRQKRESSRRITSAGSRLCDSDVKPTMSQKTARACVSQE